MRSSLLVARPQINDVLVGRFRFARAVRRLASTTCILPWFFGERYGVFSLTPRLRTTVNVIAPTRPLVQHRGDLCLIKSIVPHVSSSAGTSSMVDQI